MDTIDVFVFCKDKKSRYTFCNERFAEAAGLDSKEQIVGKSDSDLIWANQYDFFREGDLKVMTGQPLIQVPELQIQVDGVKEITTSKSVLLTSDNSVGGVIGSFIENTGKTFVKKEGLFDPIKNRIRLGEGFSEEYLTYQEALVYFHLLHGMPNSQIAEAMFLSNSGIGYHVENLKRKLQCKRRGDLIAVGISTGLTHTVFDVFLNK
ncbi:MAG: PAS domain-containing protein [Pseudomonadales bacterium]|nr:PAS domain-containing protein [Pseudomonadales bacterium]